jgi:hypothetical protein
MFALVKLHRRLRSIRDFQAARKRHPLQLADRFCSLMQKSSGRAGFMERLPAAGAESER